MIFIRKANLVPWYLLFLLILRHWEARRVPRRHSISSKTWCHGLSLISNNPHTRCKHLCIIFSASAPSGPNLFSITGIKVMTSGIAFDRPDRLSRLRAFPYDRFKIYMIVPIVRIELNSIQAIEVVSVVRVVCDRLGSVSIVWTFFETTGTIGTIRTIIMRAVFRTCGNETQLGLQLVEKLATPLVRLGLHRRSKILYPNHFLTLDPKSIRRDASFARLDFQTVRAKGRKVASKIEEFFPMLLVVCQLSRDVIGCWLFRTTFTRTVMLSLLMYRLRVYRTPRILYQPHSGRTVSTTVQTLRSWRTVCAEATGSFHPTYQRAALERQCITEISGIFFTFSKSTGALFCFFLFSMHNFGSILELSLWLFLTKELN